VLSTNDILCCRERKKDSYNRIKLDVNEKISGQEIEENYARKQRVQTYVEDHELFAIYLQIICTANAMRNLFQRSLSRYGEIASQHSSGTKRNMTEIHRDVFTPQRHEELCRTELSRCADRVYAGASTSWGDD